MKYILPILLGYLLGCSHMAFYIGKLKKLDIRSAGSGNLGASNATVLFGWGSGVLVALHDIGKGYLAVLLAKWLFPELSYAGAAAGVACVLGHIFPFYLKFKGGKGLASYFGMTLALNWRLALLLGTIIVLATLITDFIAIGTLGTILVAPVYVGITTHDLLLAAILCIATAVMLCKHWENIVRIVKKEEIGLRATARGDNRVDK
ncbi:MAG: glycerol-3-phosphate acyltransferase [Oscillospiraceae bacterium]|nr:glycerol-3-phosphate acyltransferase [Oscillospiraceae bacterium]